MRSRKSINKPQTASNSLVLQSNVNKTIPLLPFILTNLDVTEWINLASVSRAWCDLLDKQCRELLRLRVLPLLKLLQGFQDPIFETLNEIFKTMETSSVTFQIHLLRAAIYYLPHTSRSKPKLLFPYNPLKLYPTEIILTEKPIITSAAQLASEEEKKETLNFNNLMDEMLALHSSLKEEIPSDYMDDLKKLFIARLKEKYLQVKYNVRDKNQQKDTDLLAEINSAINTVTNEVKADLKKTALHSSVNEIIFHTLNMTNALVALYRIYKSPRDTQTIFLQAAAITSVILLPLAIIRIFHENKKDRGERLTLFSSNRDRKQAQRTAELEALMSASETVPPDSPRPF